MKYTGRRREKKINWKVKEKKIGVKHGQKRFVGNTNRYSAHDEKFLFSNGTVRVEEM